MWFCIVLLKYTSSGGSICYSKPFIYLSASIVPSKTCKLPISYALCTPYHQRCWILAGKSPSSLARRTWRLWFPTRMSNLDSSDHRTLFNSVKWKQSILNGPWPTGHDGASGPCTHMASFLYDRALVGISRCHDGLCLPTVVSGSIPGPI